MTSNSILIIKNTLVWFSTTMNNFDQDDLMLADLSTDYNPDDIIDHINVNELIYTLQYSSHGCHLNKTFVGCFIYAWRWFLLISN